MYERLISVQAWRFSRNEGDVFTMSYQKKNNRRNTVQNLREKTDEIEGVHEKEIEIKDIDYNRVQRLIKTIISEMNALHRFYALACQILVNTPTFIGNLNPEFFTYNYKTKPNIPRETWCFKPIIIVQKTGDFQMFEVEYAKEGCEFIISKGKLGRNYKRDIEKVVSINKVQVSCETEISKKYDYYGSFIGFGSKNKQDNTKFDLSLYNVTGGRNLGKARSEQGSDSERSTTSHRFDSSEGESDGEDQIEEVPKSFEKPLLPFNVTAVDILPNVTLQVTPIDYSDLPDVPLGWDYVNGKVSRKGEYSIRETKLIYGFKVEALVSIPETSFPFFLALRGRSEYFKTRYYCSYEHVDRNSPDHHIVKFGDLGPSLICRIIFTKVKYCCMCGHIITQYFKDSDGNYLRGICYRCKENCFPDTPYTYVKKNVPKVVKSEDHIGMSHSNLKRLQRMDDFFCQEEINIPIFNHKSTTQTQTVAELNRLATNVNIDQLSTHIADDITKNLNPSLALDYRSQWINSFCDTRAIKDIRCPITYSSFLSIGIVQLELFLIRWLPYYSRIFKYDNKSIQELRDGDVINTSVPIRVIEWASTYTNEEESKVPLFGHVSRKYKLKSKTLKILSSALNNIYCNNYHKSMDKEAVILTLQGQLNHVLAPHYHMRQDIISVLSGFDLGSNFQ